ncbi:MAG: hypothetical protein C0623_05060 [Desulfuromonas sp.]|nr:MAG: hypothetical protein C0623_05060 [Desulfuromonas sp.]
MSELNKQRRGQSRQKVRQRVLTIVIALLLIISLAHLCRLLTGAELMVGGKLIPVWVSLPGFAGPALLAGLLWWSRD